MAQRVKNPPAVQETQKIQIQFLGQEDPLEEAMATHSSILTWKIQWTEEPGGCSPWGHKESDKTEGLRVHTHTHTHTLRVQRRYPHPHLFPSTYTELCFSSHYIYSVLARS